MPFGNGTGPAGYGPRTGRAAGYCAGYGMPGSMNTAVPRRGRFSGGGLGRGHGMGAGRGFGRGFGGFGGGAYPPPQAYGAYPPPQYGGYPPPQYGGGSWAAPVPPSYARYAADPAAGKEQELDYLKGELDYLQKDSEAIRKRISALEAENAAKPEA